MVTLTCFVADCNRSSDGTPPPAITDLTPQGQPLGKYFQNASGAAQLDIALDWSRRNILPSYQSSGNSLFQNSGMVSQDELLSVLPRVLGADEASNPPSIGLFLADRYDAPGAGGQYGFMFDIDRQDGSSGQRQGCALFLRAIWDKFFSQDPGTGEPAFREAVAYIAVHELGHAFNLWHTGDTSFMQANPAPEQLGLYSFDAQQKGYLALAASTGTADFVLPGPGREPFGTLAPGFSGADGNAFAGPSADADGLDLRIALSHDEFWTFEPVELDVLLHLPETAAAPVGIPNEIDPGYTSFQIWVTRPDGERFRYRAQTRFCQANGVRDISPGETVRRDIAIGRQSGGFTFSIAGEYQVQVALRLAPGRFLLSNVSTCAVRPANPASVAWADISALLQSHAAQRLLRFKRWAPPYHECARLARFADEAASPATADAIDYALGKALLRTAKTVSHEDYAEDIRRRGISHLRRGLDRARLGPHRTGITTALLEAASGSQA